MNLAVVKLRRGGHVYIDVCLCLLIGRLLLRADRQRGSCTLCFHVLCSSIGCFGVTRIAGVALIKFSASISMLLVSCCIRVLFNPFYLIIKNKLRPNLTNFIEFGLLSVNFYFFYVKY